MLGLQIFSRNTLLRSSDMDFGVMNMEGLVSSDNGGSEPDPTNPKKNHGFGFLLNQTRSAFPQDNTRHPTTDDAFQAPKTMSYQQGSLLRSNSLISSSSGENLVTTQNMLSFSTSNNNSNDDAEAEVLFPYNNAGLVERNNQDPPFRLYQQHPSYIRNPGYGSGPMNVSAHSPFAVYRGPFTPAQWMELEHQALIYKHIVANMPIPSSLLIALKKSLNSFAFSASDYGSYAPNSYGWGSFHLGFARSTDPEPGRCRRTDGKKWRCSKDAVLEQKYCERHINRGRHRSRKPVEGQNGHTLSKSSTTAKKVTVAVQGPVVPPPPILSSSTTNNSLGPTQLHQFENLQPVGPRPAFDDAANRLQHDQGLTMLSPTVSLKSKDSPFSIPKNVAFEESSHSEFGRVSSDSLIYPSQKNPSRNGQRSDSLLGFDDHEWPKDQSDRTTIMWQEELKSDRTCLSMSIPMTSSDSPPREKVGLSPLSIAHEFDPVQLEASVDHKQTNWIPIEWGNSMGGPLGEVLNNSCVEDVSKGLSARNIITKVWDGGVQTGSSPTGVLQKASFISLSNSSSGSSPRGDKNGIWGGSF